MSILYNMRNRGPLEYDKFVLNFFQFSNEVNDLLDQELSDTEDIGSFLNLQSQITELFLAITGKNDLVNHYNTVMGFSEKLYLASLDMKEN